MDAAVDARAIENHTELSVTSARAAFLAIAEAGYRAIQTPSVVYNNVTRQGDDLVVAGKAYHLPEYDHVFVLGVGKCSLDVAHPIAELLGDQLTEGLLIDVRTGPVPPRIQMCEGTHPFASAQNVTHTRALLDIAERAGPRDLVLMFVSGGGSALLCQPKTHTPIEEVHLVRHLFKCGATIVELNTVRKHISTARGGHVAEVAYPAELVALLFSDVPGDDIAVIASGPTVLDYTTRSDAEAVLEKYHADRTGFSFDYLFETPKEAHFFERVRNELVLTNAVALQAMREKAEELGYRALVRDTRLQGESRLVARDIVAELHAASPRTVLLYGGETTVTITGPGKGGRNEELALAALPLLKEDELVCSLASDGRDNTDYAGGVADAHTFERARQFGLDPANYLDTNDSYSFFHTLQQGVRVGYTGANVADLIIGIKDA